jgi:hypothetical protein
VPNSCTARIEAGTATAYARFSLRFLMPVSAVGAAAPPAANLVALGSR